jgi:hypothetical protein
LAGGFLLLAVEIPEAKTCEPSGKFVGYAVRVPSGEIMKRYSDDEVRARWGDSLGKRLRTEK